MKSVDDYLSDAASKWAADGPAPVIPAGPAVPTTLSAEVIQIALLMATVDVLAFVSLPPLVQVASPQLSNTFGAKPIRSVGSP